MHFLCVILVIAISFLPAEGEVCEERSSFGRKFMLAVMGTWENDDVTTINVNIAADGEGHVNISAPSINLNRTYHLKDGVTTVALNRNIVTTINGTGRTGILLESNIDVTVRVLVDGKYGAEQEGYLALPIPPHGSSSYVLASWMPHISTFPSEFLIASATDNATVIITDFARQPVSSQSIILNKFDAYQMQFRNVDPSGTFIYATGPVSVLSGSQCSEVLFRSCQPLVEQLVPVSNWGQSYITPALQAKHWNVIRVYTANDTAKITLSNSSLTITLNISSFDYTTILYQDEPLSIQSDRPVQVMQYNTGYGDGDIGDEFMMTIPDVNSFLSEYKMKPLTIWSNDVHRPVYLTITIDQTHETGLVLNGDNLTSISRHYRVGTSQGIYSVITTRLTVDVEYVLRHRTPGVTFGALLYGYPQLGVGYGYGLGMKLRVEGCTTPIPTTTTPVPDTTTSPLPTSQAATTTVPSITTSVTDTTTSLLPTSHTETIRPGHGLRCMACEDMTHVELCDIVKRCNEMEVCFLEKYSVSGGITRFRSGCEKPSECSMGTSQSGNQFVDGCKTCCSENYCNHKGCGELGLPAIGSRGPLCYSCSYVTSVDECTTVDLCYPGQVCRVSKFEWGGQLVHYQLGCASEQMCKTNPSRVYRSVPVCHNCCDSDFCNTSCNNTVRPGESLIG